MKNILLIINIISFVVYMLDKFLAIHDKFRISEKSLLIISLLGGAYGGYLAMNIFHHKTKKWYFQLINILSIIFYTFFILIKII